MTVEEPNILLTDPRNVLFLASTLPMRSQIAYLTTLPAYVIPLREIAISRFFHHGYHGRRLLIVRMPFKHELRKVLNVGRVLAPIGVLVLEE